MFDIAVKNAVRRNIYTRHHRLEVGDIKINEALGEFYVKKHFEGQDTSLNIINWSQNSMDTEYHVRLLD